MNSKLLQLTDEFCRNSKTVNNLTKKRQVMGASISENIEHIYNTAVTVYDGLRQVVSADINWNEKNSIIFSRCTNLLLNAKHQKVYIELLRDNKTKFLSEIENISEIIDSLTVTLKKTEEYLKRIMNLEQEIIVLDRLTASKKKYQIQSIRTLQKLSSAINGDTEIAEADSAENTRRGEELTEIITAFPDIVSQNDSQRLKFLLDEVNAGIIRAGEVNTNSRTQANFSEQVLAFVEEFISASYDVQELIQEKHDLFEQNLQNITVLTVLISFELKKYLEAQKILDTLPYDVSNKNAFVDLIMLVDIAADDVKFLTDLNLDMTEISHVNNENETRTVESGNAEQMLFGELKDQVVKMTELTHEPIRLSEENRKIAESIKSDILSILAANNIELSDTKDFSGGNDTMSKKVMIIDDGAAIRQVVSHVLKSEGYEVEEAIDGQDALSKLDGGKIDLFICDVNMPNMNGIEFLEKIKTDEEYRSYKFAPIIMLTTESGQSMKEKGKQLGAHAWMVKPFQPDQLIAKIKPILG